MAKILMYETIERASAHTPSINVQQTMLDGLILQENGTKKQILTFNCFQPLSLHLLPFYS